MLPNTASVRSIEVEREQEIIAALGSGPARKIGRHATVKSSDVSAELVTEP